MKKLLFSLTALALCAMMFTSCKKDKNDDDEPGLLSPQMTASLSGSSNVSFSTTQAFSYTSSGSKLLATFSDIFSGGTTLFLGKASNGKLGIIVKGSESGTYDTEIPNAQSAIIQYLTNKTLPTGTIEALIIYDATSTDENSVSENYYISYDASVSITTTKISSITYTNGSFSGTLINKAGDKFTLSSGVLKNIYGYEKSQSK